MNLWSIFFILIGIIVLLGISLGLLIERDTISFYRQHQCYDVENGYICRDGAVMR